MTDDELLVHLNLLGAIQQDTKVWKYIFHIKELAEVPDHYHSQNCIYRDLDQNSTGWEIGDSTKKHTPQEIYDFLIKLKKNTNDR